MSSSTHDLIFFTRSMTDALSVTESGKERVKEFSEYFKKIYLALILCDFIYYFLFFGERLFKKHLAVLERFMSRWKGGGNHVRRWSTFL